MTYLYPAWFDWLAYTLCPVGIAIGIFAYGTEPGRLRGISRTAAFLSLGAGLCFGGAANLLANARSPKIEITGTASDVEIYTGKHAHTDFRVDCASCPVTRFTIDHPSHPVTDGMSVNVVYQEYSKDLLRLTALEGDEELWHLSQSDSTIQGAFAMLGGLYMLGLGVFGTITDPKAEYIFEIDLSSNPNSKMPEGIDEKSLLNLSKHE